MAGAVRSVESSLAESADEEGAVGALGAIRAAWSRTRVDPFGVLGPALLALWFQATALVLWWGLPLDWPLWIASGIVVQLAVGAMVAPFRAAILGAGSRVAGRQGRGMGRGLSLAGVLILVAALQGLAIVAVAVGWSLVAGLLLSYGLVSLTALWGAACLILGVVAVFALRVRFAYAPVLAVDGGRAAWRALASPPGIGWARTAFVVLGCDLLVVLGTMLAGAGALPTYPLRDLALQRLWEDL